MPYLHSNQLFSLAKKAYWRIATEIADNDPCHEEAIISIVFSCCALEAFVNDLGALAVEEIDRCEYVKHKPGNEMLVFSEVMTALNNQRASFLDRIDNAKRLSTGVDFDQGVLPYQDLALLVKLRNHIVHKKATKSEIKDGSLLAVGDTKLRDKCRERKILANPDDPKLTLFDAITTKAAARWACNTASIIIHEFKGKGIDHNFVMWFDTFFHGGQFTPIEDSGDQQTRVSAVRSEDGRQE